MTRALIRPPGLLMAETDIPDKFWPAIRLVVNNLVWILPLVAIEQAVTGELQRAGLIGVVFVVDLVIAVKWGRLDTVIKKAGRMNGIQLALLIGIVGSWAFITMALGSAAWMIWAHQAFTATSQSAPVDEGPIQWNGTFGIEGDLATKVFSLRFLGTNISKTAAIQLREAKILSAIDGSLENLEIVASDSDGNTKIVPISQIQLIPPGARIELVAKFGPADPTDPTKILGVEPKRFLERGRQFSFIALDDTGRAYRFDFNDNNMMPFFQGKVGPRVTIKP